MKIGSEIDLGESTLSTNFNVIDRLYGIYKRINDLNIIIIWVNYDYGFMLLWFEYKRLAGS